MSVTIASTTDDAASVNAAATAGEGDELVRPAEHDAQPAREGDVATEATYTKNVASADPPEAVAHRRVAQQAGTVRRRSAVTAERSSLTRIPR